MISAEKLGLLFFGAELFDEMKLELKIKKSKD